MLIFLITLVTASPYLIRNFIIFDKITIVETSGYNLWKRNHPLAVKNSVVEGLDFSPERDIKLSEQIDAIPRDKFYRINIFNGHTIASNTPHIIKFGQMRDQI